MAVGRAAGFDGDGQGGAQRLLLEEVARVVADAKQSGDTLRTGYHAGLLFAAYPYTFSIGRIMEELALAATKEGVPLDIGRL